MQARTEITGRYARAYAKASKLEEGELLDEIAQSPAGARRARADAWWPQPSAHYSHRKTGVQDQSPQVLLRHLEDPPAGVGRQRRAALQVLQRVHAAAAKPAGDERRARDRARVLRGLSPPPTAGRPSKKRKSRTVNMTDVLTGRGSARSV